MSKQSEAKDKQGYVDKAVPSVCGTCAHYLSETETTRGVFGGEYIIESQRRCGLAGFAVKKMGTCRLWKSKP